MPDHGRWLVARVAIIIGALLLVTSGIAMGASGAGAGSHRAGALTNRDDVYCGGASISGTVTNSKASQSPPKTCAYRPISPSATMSGTTRSPPSQTQAGPVPHDQRTGIRLACKKVSFADCDQVVELLRLAVRIGDPQ